MWILALLACGVSAPEADSAHEGPSPAPATDTALEASPSWQAGPPDGPEGTEVSGVVTCSLLTEPVEVTFVKTADPWRWMFHGDGLTIPELEPCTAGVPPDVVLWEDTPRLTILTGGLLHALSPTGIEGHWLGTVLPFEGSNPACDAALADLGLSWPITMSLAIDPPQEG